MQMIPLLLLTVMDFVTEILTGGAVTLMEPSPSILAPKKPVFVPLGKFDICDRFPDNFRGDGKKGPWFNTVGSNYGCSSATCCLWFPPIKCADVPLVKYAFLPFEHNGVQYNDC